MDNAKFSISRPFLNLIEKVKFEENDLFAEICSCQLWKGMFHYQDYKSFKDRVESKGDLSFKFARRRASVLLLSISGEGWRYFEDGKSKCDLFIDKKFPQSLAISMIGMKVGDLFEIDDFLNDEIIEDIETNSLGTRLTLDTKWYRRTSNFVECPDPYERYIRLVRNSP